MSVLKILLIISTFIISGPFRAFSFPNPFPLFLYTFPLSIFPIEIIGDLYPFCPHHIQYVHDPNVVMRPIIRIVRVRSHRISMTFEAAMQSYNFDLFAYFHSISPWNILQFSINRKCSWNTLCTIFVSVPAVSDSILIFR